ncbi:Bbp19 family protein [Pseudomonas solani]|uniref:Bbp19 family protein n=1 Tax=Pseudomonas solani TaxID=2731552 RepID=UPI003D6C31A7
MTELTNEQQDALFKRVFEDHHEGRIALEILIQRYARNAVTAGGIDAILKTYIQAGNREVLDHILLRINRANGVQVTEEEDA